MQLGENETSAALLHVGPHHVATITRSYSTNRKPAVFYLSDIILTTQYFENEMLGDASPPPYSHANASRLKMTIYDKMDRIIHTCL